MSLFMNHDTLYGYSDCEVESTDLPRSNVVDPLPERPLMDVAQLEGVSPDLDEVVEEGAHPGQRVRGGEQSHVAELDEHLKVVLKRAFVLRKEKNKI